MRRWLLLLALAAAVLTPAGAVAAAGQPALPSPYQLAHQQLDQLDTAPIQSFVQQLDRELAPYGLGLSWQNITALVRSRKLPWRPQDILGALVRAFGAEVTRNLALLGELLVLVVLAAVLRHIQSAWDGDTVGRLADTVVFLALGAIALVGFAQALSVARGAVTDLGNFMLALLPALLGLLLAGGAVASAGLLHPAVVLAVNLVGRAVGSFVFPILLLAAVLDIVSALSPRFRVTSLAALMRQVGLGLMGLLLAAFVGVVAVEGAAGAVADGVALRAAKYAAKAFVPVVGGMFADAAELVVTSGFLVRSGLGIAGLIIIALAAALPLLKLMAMWLCFRLAAALAQPVGAEAVGHVLSGLASTVALFAVAVGVVGMMFFLSLTVLVGAGGAVLVMH